LETEEGGISMSRFALMTSLGIWFLWIPDSYAIPPPWQLEEMKARADVIAIAKTAAIETVKDVRPFNRKVGVCFIQVLKGDAQEAGHLPGQKVQANVFYFQPDVPQVPGGIAAVSVGGPGHPTPAASEHALVFLKRLEGKQAFSVVCGRFGYLRLTARSANEAA
jgi:hypothetical protein